MASKYKGYVGRAVCVDLYSGKVSDYAIRDEDRELYLGGRYLSTKILWDELRPGIDPLSGDNIIVVMTAPLTGTNAPSSSRYDISAKSPLTGGIGHSNSGGNFGVYLKRCGFDALLVKGRAKKPVYLHVTEGTVVIRDASKLWGMNTQEAQDAMIGKCGKGGTMAIGPAGENLVKYASIASQERMHGRTGMGAVMGSKNIKGMIATGSGKIEFHKPEEFKEHIKKWMKMLKDHPATGESAPRYGTAGFLTTLSLKNALPTRNFSSGSFKDAYMIGGERLADEFLVKNMGCLSCPIRCGRVVNIDGREVKGPEYEILSLLGSNMLINDMEAIIRWNYEADLLGLDTISMGTTIGFAAELNEKGLWKTGIEFGRKDNISRVMKDIAYKKGIGKELAEGVRYLKKKYGGQDFAPEVKGLEIPAYEPRGATGHALGYAVANRGACHLDGGYMIYFEATGPITLNALHWRSKPSWVVLDQNLLSAVSAGGNCLFTAWTFVPGIAYKTPGSVVMSKIVTGMLTHSWKLIEWMLMLPEFMMNFHLPILPHTKAIALATGMKFSYGKYMKIGDRGNTLERMFNLREGITGAEDRLARRFTDEPQQPGNSKTMVPLAKMLPKYYKIRGWDSNGVPKPGTLRKLKISV
jgi:aldehyde:ferredoxin oxidoreductase